MSKFNFDISEIASWKLWSIIASCISGLVVVIAFLIPSFEDQYDRYKSRQVIQGYVKVGNALMADRKYRLAEEAFATAFEMSSNERLDIEVLRLRAKIEIINEENDWGTALPSHIDEVDLVYFLHLSEHAGDQEQLSVAHSSYALYLAAHKKLHEAQKHLEIAVKIDPMNYGAVVDLGNLFGDFKNTSAAIEQFEKAIQLRPEHYLAYYNLGMVYLEGQQRTKAIDFLSKAYKLRPEVSIEKELKRAHLLK